MQTVDVLIQFLKDKEITQVFAICGGYNIFILEKLHLAGYNVIYFHHEQALIFAAQGYYRQSGKIPLCLVTAGPGVMNTINGVYGCWTDSIPLFLISGHCSLNQIASISDSSARQLGQQDSPINEILSPITKFNVLITDVSKFYQILSQAYFQMISNRMGPVFISLPLDLQRCKTVINKISKEVNTGYNFDPTTLIKYLNQSERPILLAGNGIRLADSVKIFNDFVKSIEIPVLTACNSGADVIDNEYRYYAGRIGINGQLTSNIIIQQADLIIIMGTRLNNRATGYAVKQFGAKAKKIIIDIDYNEINKHKFDVEYGICQNLVQVLNQLNSKQIHLNIQGWKQYIIDKRKEQYYFYPKHQKMQHYLSYYYFLSRFKQFTGDTSIVLANGSAHVSTFQSLVLNSNQRMYTNVGSASMGWALPAAIGASLSDNNKQVICIQGDGSIMMNLQQLQTVVHNKLPIKLFIINNSGYVSARITEKTFCQGRYFGDGFKGKDISFPSFKNIALAFGIQYYCIHNNQDIDNVLSAVMAKKELTMIELVTYPEEFHEPKVISKGMDNLGNIIPGQLTVMTISEE